MKDSNFSVWSFECENDVEGKHIDGKLSSQTEKEGEEDKRVNS